VLSNVEEDRLQILFEAVYYDNLEDSNKVSTKEMYWFGREEE
jgi:hypothetical protein